MLTSDDDDVCMLSNLCENYVICVLTMSFVFKLCHFVLELCHLVVGGFLEPFMHELLGPF